MAQRVKHLPAMQETWVQSLGREDPLEKATHSNTLAWKIPWMEKPGRVQSIGLQRVGHNEQLHFHFHFYKSYSIKVIMDPDFPGGSNGKESACNAGDHGSIPGSGKSPGEGNGNPLQCFCLDNSMDRGAWWAIVHGVSRSCIRLSNFTFIFTDLEIIILC